MIYPTIFENIQKRVLDPLGRHAVDVFGAFDLQGRSRNDTALHDMLRALDFVAWESYTPPYRKGEPTPCSIFVLLAHALLTVVTPSADRP